MFSCAPVFGDTFVWTGPSASGNNNWSNPANWLSGVPLSANTTDLVFAAAQRASPVQDLANPLVIRGIFFSDTTYSLGGNALTFAGQFAGIFNSTTVTIANNVALTSTITYQQDGNATFTSYIEGPGGFIKNGTGAVTFGFYNTYGGDTEVNAGQIVLAHHQGLLYSTLRLNVHNGVVFNGQAAVIGNLAGSGNLNLGTAAVDVGSNNTSQTYSGQITGTGSVSKTGSGDWALTRAGSSFPMFSVVSGRTLLTGGSLTLTSPSTTTSSRALTVGGFGAAALDVTAGAVLNTVGGGTGAALVAGRSAYGVSGAGTVNVAGVGSRWDAAQIDLGTGVTMPGALVVDNAGVVNATDVFVGKPAGGSLVVQNGGAVNAARLTVSGDPAVSSPAVAVRSGGQATATETILATPTSSVDVDRGVLRTAMLTSAAGNGSITLRDPVGGSALVIDGTGASATYAGAISGSGGITKNGESTQTLSGVNTYNGPTTVNGGTLVLSSGASASYNAYGAGKITLAFGDVGHSSLRVGKGGTIHYPSTVVGGFIRGSDGTHDLKEVTSFNGTTFGVDSALTQNTPLALNNVSNGGNFTSNESLAWDGGVNTSAGRFTVYGKATVTAFVNDGAIAIRGGGLLTNADTTLVSGGGGRIDIDSKSRLELVSSELDLNGSLLVNDGVVRGTVNVRFNGLATGTGEFGKVNLFDNGRFAPGAGANPAVFSPAAVSAEQASFAPATALAVQIGGREAGTGYDRVDVAGAAALGGVLEISTAAGFAPAGLDAFRVLTFKSRAGAFSTYTGTDAGNGLIYAPVYGNEDLTLVATLPGDATVDGRVNFSDLLTLAKHYNVAGETATWVTGDFTYDGRVNFSDLLALAKHYNQSAVPAAGQFSPAFEGDWAAALREAAGVPEPATGVAAAALMMGALAAAGRRRRRAAIQPREQGGGWGRVR